MLSSAPIGWGESPWGTQWGGVLGGSGGPLPEVAPFTTYYVGDYNDITLLLTYDQVSTIGEDLQFPVDAVNGAQDLTSGGSAPTSTAAILMDVNVPEDFTFQFVAAWPDLPVDFSDLVDTHSYFGTFSPDAACVGLFFSQEGICYTGSIHFDSSGNIVLDTPVMPLPNSQTLVSEGAESFWVVRVAVSYSTGTVYVFVTLKSELLALGHQLRYILPVIPSSSAAMTPSSQTVVSVRCNPAPVTVSIESIALGPGVLIPVIPPTADPGVDQAIQLCEILQLDGTLSTDPQGASLTYLWQLIDAPSTSQYIYTETDGRTYPLSSPTGFTNLLYSSSLAAVNALLTIQAGGVIVLRGVAYTILSTGTDGTGFYAMITGYDFPDNVSTPTPFLYLPQNGLNTATDAKPTFYPDVSGFFKFQLTVYDGAAYSLPNSIVVNVVESAIARGCIPDLSFVWNYLSNFWSLVEGTERITVFWQGLAQVAAAELLNLWQVDYGKSLRDVQRTFQRRWLHYDLLMQENPNLVEVTSVEAIFGGVYSASIANAGISGVAGTHLDLQLATRTLPVVIPFTQSDPYTPVMLQEAIQALLQQYDTGIVVTIIDNQAGTASVLRIDAQYPITVLRSSTAPFYAVGETNEAPQGTAGAALGTNTYRVEVSLQDLEIPTGSFLCIDGVAYRIATVITAPSDLYPGMRLTLSDTLPTPCGSSWFISGTATSTDLDFWNGMCEQGDIVTFEIIQNSNQALTTITSVVLGSCPQEAGTLPVDATPVGVYLAQPALYSVYLLSVLRRRYIPLDPLLVDIPLLQELIVNTDDTQVLRRNVDYFFSTFRGASCLMFVTPVPANAAGSDVWQGGAPPARMWAETSYLDNRPRIEGTFGIPAEFTLEDLAQLPSNVDYLSSVQGLWYAYWNGPTLFNLRAGTQILLGLPFAEEAGTIVQIRNDFSETQGQILVQDTATAAIVRDYSYPVTLSLETNPATGKPYAVGDTVTQFAPLVTGVEVVDYVSDPTWFEGYLEQGAFFEVEKFFKFLVRVDASAFNLQALLFCQTFINRIKPTYTYPLFVVLATVPDADVTVSDSVLNSGMLNIFDGACSNGYIGVATMFDQPQSAGGGWRNQFDASPFAAPSYPTPSLPILWGFDKAIICPEDALFATLSTTIGTSIPIFDSIFQFDSPVYTEGSAEFSSGALLDLPVGTGATTIGAGSNFLTLPQYSIDVVDTTGMAPEGIMYVTTADGVVEVQYTGVTSNVVFGCTGGSGMMSTGGAVVSGRPVGTPFTVTASGTINTVELTLNAEKDSFPNTYQLIIQKNGVTAQTIPFTMSPTGIELGSGASIAVIVGDVLSCYIQSTITAPPNSLSVFWEDIFVSMGQAVAWSFDTALSAGTYLSYRGM